VSFGAIFVAFLFIGCGEKTVVGRSESLIWTYDIDGNQYASVQIGNQCWMSSNLRVTHYRNGDPIPNIIDNNTWKNLNSGAYCDYPTYSYNPDFYGHLYNWYAVTDSRNIAPEGWHIPNKEEWQTLIDFLGGDSTAGGALKVKGTVYWSDPNTGATNSSGFCVYPGGCRNPGGTYMYRYSYAYFWSRSGYDNTMGWYRRLNFDNIEVLSDSYLKQYGFSVRCVKD
jgi:uncharacterized protein (TIGR02145 family)